MKHKLVVDAVSLLSSLTGIGRYTYEIIRRLAEKDVLEINYFYGYYSKNLIQPSNGSSLKTFKSILSKYGIVKKIIRKILHLKGKFLAPTYDLYWEPNFIPLENIKAKKIITSVHDFSFELYKDFHPQERIEYFENYFFKNIYKSDVIITGSYYTKKEILERLNFQEEQIKVIYHGVDHKVFKIYDDLSLSFQLPKRFIFCVGSIEPRKNLLGLLQAYHLLPQKFKEDYSLVLAGFSGWNNTEVMQLIEEDKEHIIYLGYVSDIELAKVYNMASLFVYPSFYEGFGLPPLEAMACGTPVVTSNVASLPEVGGDAVVYCDPYDVEDIKEKIEMVLSDENLQEEMIKKGLQRAKKFTWEKAASEHLKLFESLI